MPILMLTAALPAGAEEITSGNFRYEIVQFVGNDEDEAVVVGLAEGYEPSGELFIPTTVSHEGKEVKVTGLGWSNHAGNEGDAPVVAGFDAVTSVRIPKYMKFIGRVEFKDCHSIEKYEVEAGSEYYTTISGSLVELNNSSSDGTRRYLIRYPSAASAATFVVPSAIDGIGWGAFAANRYLKKIYLIGEQRLRECWQYNNRSIETVDCTNSSEYRVNDDGALLYGSIFTGLCPGRVYDKYTIPETCSYIESGAFCSSQIGEVVVPGKFSSQAAGMNMFLESDVSKVTWQGSAPWHFWEGAFMGCRKLESMTFGATSDGELDINTCAFKDCESLTTVTLAENTKDIDIAECAFEGCRSLTAFPLTSKMKIKQLVYREFAGCESMTSFAFGSVKTFGFTRGYMFAGTGLKTVHWPTGQAVIPRGCFADCRQLTKAYLKDTTTDIYANAFARSGIVGLNMMGVDWFSASAFNDCPDLMRLYFPDNGSTVQYHAIDFMTDDPQVVVNNPTINFLDEQEDFPDVASLYVSMVDGGIAVGDGWRKVYVPGRASELYCQLTASPVEEMYTYETDAEGTAVRVVPHVTGVKVTSVEINGETATYAGGWFKVTGPAAGGAMKVTVNYTVFGNAMNSSYTGIYSGVETVVGDDESESEEWYTLDGLRVDRRHSAPGIYISRKGKAVIND